MKDDIPQNEGKLSPDEASSTALVPVEERSVDFYGDQITAVLVQVENSQEVYVPLRPISDYLGLSWSSQLQRTRHDEVLNEKLIPVLVSNTEKGRGRGRGRREVICLPLKFLPGWLFGIDASRVKPELKEKIIRYRRECYDVLWRAFESEAAGVAGSAVTASSQTIAALEQLREMGRAIMQMAEQQLELEQRLDTHESRLNRAAQVVGEIQRHLNAQEGRLRIVESRVAPAAYIDDEQATTISATVKALAEFMNGKEPGKNHYQGIFAELYRRWGVSTYKALRRNQYQEVLDFLEDWRKSFGLTLPE